MKLTDFKFVGRLWHEIRGAEIAEAAAVLPIMFMVLLGIFWFGQAFSIYGAITRAAQEGARAGSVPQCTSCGSTATYNTYATAAQTAVSNALLTSNLDPTQMPSVTPPTFTPCPGVVTACGPGQACVQLPVQLETQSQGTTDCGISVFIQYPFKFWLPFTSINNQQILLSASASARMEAN
jgi:hypothetical protein